jgi:17beta-estradiol 17-dehydrogenase / very-long-chain 3-oxoacyl-CoA reductase
MDYTLLFGITCLVAYALRRFYHFHNWVKNWCNPADIRQYKKYGEWAIVTGCTSGIGLEMAKILSDNGYKLILVGRSEVALQQLEAQFRGSVYAICDFSEDKFDYASIQKVMRGKEVSILINNAGVCQDKKNFGDTDVKEIVNIMRVNVTNTILFSLLVMEKMKGGVVANIASGSALAPGPYMSIYAASKACLLHWGQSLQLEYRHCYPQFIIQNYTPFYISTKMTEMKPTITIPSSDTWARSALGQLGRGDTTGYIYHDMMQWVLSCMPKKIADQYVLDSNRPIID